MHTRNSAIRPGICLPMSSSCGHYSDTGLRDMVTVAAVLFRIEAYDAVLGDLDARIDDRPPYAAVAANPRIGEDNRAFNLAVAVHANALRQNRADYAPSGHNAPGRN